MERTWAERLMPHVRHGLGALALAAAKRGLRPWLDVGIVVVFEIPFELAKAADALPVVRIGAGEAPAVARVFGRSTEDLLARLARGDRGWAVMSDDRPAHMRWATTEPTLVPEVALWMCPGPGEVYVYDMETEARVRGKRFSAAGRAVMDAELWQAGFRRKLAYVRADNHAMWHALHRAPGPIRILYRLRYLRWSGGVPLVLGRHGAPLFAEAPPLGPLG